MKGTCVRGWNSPVWDVKLSCTQRRGVSSTTAMTMTTASGGVEYKAIQGVHKDSRPLIGRTLCRRSDWMNALTRSDESVSTYNCGVSGRREVMSVLLHLTVVVVYAKVGYVRLI